MKHIFYSFAFMLAALIAGNAEASRNHFKKSIPDSHFRWYDGNDMPLKGKGFAGEPLYGRVPATPARSSRCAGAPERSWLSGKPRDVRMR